MERDCPRCGATCAENASVCSYCASWLVTPTTAVEELALLREMQRLSQGLEFQELNSFWLGAPLMTRPEAMLQDVIQSLARLKPGSESWDLNSYDGELNKITKQRIETLLLSLKMEAHPETTRKVALLESEYRKRAEKAGCFPAEARVWTPEGLRPIAEFVPGDRVLSYDPTTQTLKGEVVTARKRHGEGMLQQITLADGSTVCTTPSHSFLTRSGWRVARRLCPADELVHVGRRGTSQTIAIVDNHLQLRSTALYNLHTTGLHSFIVRGLVAHNFTHWRGLRTCLHRLVLDPLYTRGWLGSSEPSRTLTWGVLPQE